MQSAVRGHAVADGDDAVLHRAIADGSLESLCRDWNERYREAARVTAAAVDDICSGRDSTSMGGLYSVVDIGTDADAFVPKALKATGVFVVPGGGFGPSLTMAFASAMARSS